MLGSSFRAKPVSTEDGSVYFFQKNSTAICQFQFFYDVNGYRSLPLSKLAGHLVYYPTSSALWKGNGSIRISDGCGATFWQINNVGRAALVGGIWCLNVIFSLLDSFKGNKSWQSSVAGAIRTIGGLVGTVSSYRSAAAAVKNRRLATDTAAAGQVAALKKLGNAMDSAIGKYGNALVAGARAGGVMGSYYSPIWKELAAAWDATTDDFRDVQFRHSMERASFAAHRAALRLRFMEKLTDGILDGFGDSNWSASGGRRRR
jgi:hypothetical protein